MSHKPQPYYARLNQPPRSPNGRNRQPTPTNHSDPADRADSSAGRPNPIRARLPAATWRTINNPVYPIPPAGSGAIDTSRMMQDIMQDMMDAMMRECIVHEDCIPKPPTLPHDGIHSGEITGYRGWIVVNAVSMSPLKVVPTLRSLAHHFFWEPGATIEGNINEWVCDNLFNPIFGGVYAFREFSGLENEIAEAELVSNWGRINWLGFAYGTVKLWGETVEHETGYRASFAKLTSIDGFVGVDEFDLETLRKRYHV